ncbi:Protein bli-3 [Colletotrichum sidae]|uniref:Protein bli-3 n=4 Tax=Colletotrichum orbiculare species complex TaxID=2707354 RepID=N4V9A7_COLOR|nr:Protein bli-3 [Colletotrichum orbiculare MAFF 240422]TDZ35518.1 Protein bli-3 [Colletotrichum spinosum]TDZ61163.1 Protein bli-3 [Colletotrichum trifolii]TEA10532.1 Protein bli-3 [Colletotrichum sidae]
MSFSNTSTGDKPADPYKAANKDDNVSLKEKVEALVNFANKSKFGMMTTRDAKSGALVSRCMALAATENGGIDLLFHTNTESNKTDEIDSDPHINISFYNGSGDWASISGVSSIITDRSLVKKHYSSALKAWVGDLGDGTHDGSENDPRIGIIRVKTVSVTYAISNTNVLGRVAQVAEGAITGSPAQVNKLREISSQEVEQYRATAST